MCIQLIHCNSADCCVFAAFSSPVHNTNSIGSLSIRSNGWLLCYSAPPATGRQSIPIDGHDDVCPPPHLSSSIAPMQLPPTLRVCKRVDCYVFEVLLRCCNCMHLGAHHLCTSRQELHQLVHSHQTISVVLMAKSAAARRSPTTVEASEGVGWLGRWFGGGAEAAGHGFDG